MVLLHCDEQMRLAEVTTTETRRGFSACHADILKVDIKIDSDRTGSSTPHPTPKQILDLLASSIWHPVRVAKVCKHKSQDYLNFT